ncbi:MAG TPA: cytochrome c [Polyangiales bacterium]|nr:cytochrome c [Polyangiales bacterium]
MPGPATVGLRSVWILACALSLCACDDDDAIAHDELEPGDAARERAGSSASLVSGHGGATAGQGGKAREAPCGPYGSHPPSCTPVVEADAGAGAPLEVVVPTDERLVERASSPPPPISGGTLLMARDRPLAVAADPDRDVVWILQLAYEPTAAEVSLRATVAFEPQALPGRLVEDGAGVVHVLLRGPGEVASISLADAKVIARRPVCAAPRGIDYDVLHDELLIACADGQLLGLPASTGEAVVRARLAPDLRDVVVSGARTFVSRFRSAELLALDDDHALVGTTVPADTQTESTNAKGGGVIHGTLRPHVAWRIVRAADGGAFMLHQGARQEEIEVAPGALAADPSGLTSAPYGGEGACEGVVQSELTRFDAEGKGLFTLRIPGVLPVDGALNSDNSRFALVVAGARDPFAPPRSLRLHDGSLALLPSGERPSVLVFATPNADVAEAATCPEATIAVDVSFGHEPIALAYAVDGSLLVQNREPAQIVTIGPQADMRTLTLPGVSVADTAHTLFHHDPGAGLACASCHPEGGEDGHVWSFAGVGARRTQALDVGLDGTAPFHWSGDIADVGALLEDVMVTRMNGVHQGPDRSDALERWLFALRPRAALRAQDDPSAVRGRALFESTAGCNACHSGERLTNNATVDVGTGEALQVPSLIGIAYRPPFLHDGRAATLRERFDDEGGGAAHGNTAELTAAELDDLIAYLEAL